MAGACFDSRNADDILNRITRKPTFGILSPVLQVQRNGIDKILLARFNALTLDTRKIRNRTDLMLAVENSIIVQSGEDKQAASENFELASALSSGRTSARNASATLLGNNVAIIMLLMEDRRIKEARRSIRKSNHGPK